jgi:hypothetical protein
MPTVEQSTISVLLGHSLSNFFRDITLFRFDVSKQEKSTETPRQLYFNDRANLFPRLNPKFPIMSFHDPFDDR